MLLRAYGKVSGMLDRLAPGQNHFNPDTPFEKSSAKSRSRFDYQLEQRKKDNHYQTTGATFSWGTASMLATKKALRNAGKIHIPITVMTAGEDHLIDPAGYEIFAKKVPQAKVHPYSTSRHEIFNSTEDTRIKYFEDVLKTLDSYL